jgi:hypothetical protein
MDRVDAGGTAEAEPSLNAEPGVVDGEEDGSAPRLETRREPEETALDAGPVGEALETEAAPSVAPVTGEQEPRPAAEPLPSSPAEEGGAREADAPAPSGIAADPDAGVEAVPGDREP